MSSSGGPPDVTTRDAAATTRDAPAATTRDGAQEGGGSGPRVLTTLPTALAAGYRIVEELAAGGAEADLLVVEPLTGGPTRIAKLYRRGIEPDPAVVEAVRRVASEHVVQLHEVGESDGRWYELLEHVRLGSLADLLQQEGPRLPLDRLREVLEELTAAVAAVHAVDVVHRDVKPANVLVRQDRPLDLVLTDFGLSSVSSASLVFVSSSRTVAYSAPEALVGAIGRPADWWSVGMTVLEALLGRHPWGGLPHQVVEHQKLSSDLDLSGVQDPRWRLLCQGLLTRRPEHRWGEQQVRAWLTGGSPVVVAAAPDVPQQRRAFRFAGTDHDDSVSLADAFGTHWRDAARLLMSRHEGQVLREHLLRDDDADRSLARLFDGWSDAVPPDLRLAQLLARLAPSLPPRWHGWSADRGGLLGLAQEALREPGSARRAVEGLVGEDALPVLAQHQGQAALAPVGAVVAQARTALPGLVAEVQGAGGPVPDERLRALVDPLLLELALDPDRHAALVAQLRTARHARRVDWWTRLGDETRSRVPGRALAALALSHLLRELAEAAGEQQHEQEQEQARQARRDRAAAARRTDRRVLRVALALTLTGVGPLLLGHLVWRRYLHDPLALPVPLQDLSWSAVLVPDLVMGTGLLALGTALLLLLRRPWRGRPQGLAAGAAALVLALGCGALGPADAAERELRAQQVHDTGPLPEDRIAGLCGEVVRWTGATGRAWTAGTTDSLDDGCTGVQVHEGWRLRWQAGAGPHRYYGVTGMYGSVYAFQVIHRTDPNYLVAVHRETGKVRWTFRCPPSDVYAAADVVMHATDGGQPGPEAPGGTRRYIEVDCRGTTGTVYLFPGTGERLPPP